MKKIIVIDDDPGILEAYNIIFSSMNYEIVKYTNAEQVFSGDFSTADLIILDKQLSGIDGTDICRFLKHNESTKDIPIIMLSASPDIGRIAELAGADDALEKPFKIKTFREVVAKHIRA